MNGNRPSMAHMLSQARVISEEPLSNRDAKWIQLKKLIYHAPDDTNRTYEYASRSTRPKNSTIDAVGVIAILEKPSGPEIVLQKQYRPPIDRICIEVPAGLVDAGEDPATAALRELREETGYVGTVLDDGFAMTPPLVNNPGFCNTNLKMVHATIDLSNPANREPRAELEDDEFIETFTVPLKDLWNAVAKFSGEGYAIDTQVGTLAEGIEVSRRWRL